MFEGENDATYYSDRERTERCLAANASTDTARIAHMALACEYRRRAMAARLLIHEIAVG
jgi:hypothetical protein